MNLPARAGRLGALLLVLPFLLSSCVSYDSWNRTTTGMSLGAFFGSTVGGILGGNRGADLGTLIGGATGAAIGAASAAKNEEQRARTYETYNNVPRDGRYGNEQVGYGRYNEGSDGYATFNGIELSNLTFSDYNGDRCLQPGERAQITFDLYNNSGSTLYNIAPVVSCDYKRVNVSPTAIIVATIAHLFVTIASIARHIIIRIVISCPLFFIFSCRSRTNSRPCGTSNQRTQICTAISTEDASHCGTKESAQTHPSSGAIPTIIAHTTAQKERQHQQQCPESSCTCRTIHYRKTFHNPIKLNPNQFII